MNIKSIRVPKIKARSIGILALSRYNCQQMDALGSNIALARKKRKIRQEDMAKRAAISVKTYRKIEKGDPAVAIGLYLAVLSIMSLDLPFSDLAEPTKDKIGLSLEKHALPDRVKHKLNKELDF